MRSLLHQLLQTPTTGEFNTVFKSVFPILGRNRAHNDHGPYTWGPGDFTSREKNGTAETQTQYMILFNT